MSSATRARALRERCLLLVPLLLALACSHEVLWLGDSPPPVPAIEPPLPVTMGVSEGSFVDTRVQGAAVVERFADALRDSRLFQGVLFPIPPGVDPAWELRLAGSDGAFEPNSNFWKSALAAAVFPTAWLVHLENDYTLELEALLVYGREVRATYPATAHIRLRYQPYANKLEVDRDALELAVSGAASEILNALAADAPRLTQELQP